MSKKDLEEALADPGNQPGDFDALEPDEREQLLAWIATTFEPAAYRQRRCYKTSYGLKHVFEHNGGCYVTNGAYKGAMIASGYVPVDSGALNWVFKDLAIRKCITLRD